MLSRPMDGRCVRGPLERRGGNGHGAGITEYYLRERPHRMVYMEDPSGNVFELYSHSYELTYSRGAYQA